MTSITLKNLGKMFGGFGIHLCGCFASVALIPAGALALGIAITPMSSMFIGMGVLTALHLGCGGYKKPKQSLILAGLGLLAIATHHMFFMDHAVMGHYTQGAVDDLSKFASICRPQ